MKIIDAKNVPAMENIHNVRAGAVYNTEHALAVLLEHLVSCPQPM